MSLLPLKPLPVYTTSTLRREKFDCQEGSMSGPSEQHNTLSSRWWVRLCQWLFRGLLFLLGTIVLGLTLNIIATWLTAKGFDLKGTPLEWIIQHLTVAIACGGVLLVLTIVAGVLSRRGEASAIHSPSALPAQQNRNALIHLLRNEYRRQMA